MNSLISIIIPIYNAQNTLNRCFLSIIKQTYTNIEVILIDDGSTDNSKFICEKYVKFDKRFKYFFKQNKGVANSRNFGIKVSTGKYITFIDADDYVSKNYIEMLYTGLVLNNCDISISLSKKIYVEKYKEIYVKSSNNVKIFSSENAIENMLLEDEIDTSFWGKLYKKDLFNNIEISDYQIFEDLDTIYKIFIKSKRILLINDKLYFYYIRKGSLTHTKFSDKNLLVLKILNDMEKEILYIYPHLYNAILCRKINANFYIIRNLDKENINYKKSKKFIVENRNKILLYSKCPLKTKIGLYISFINFNLIRPMFYIQTKINIFK